MNKWDERYNRDEYVYGIKPNDFLASQVKELPKGRVLCLAEGEGRNAVFLAEQGYEVWAVDSSEIGLQKAQKLAKERGVTIHTEVADLADFVIEPDSWDAIISIFCHVPPPIRKELHKNSIEGPRKGGVFLLEAYTRKQLQYKTGGPPTEVLMMSLYSLQTELVGLDMQIGQELVRPVVEGILHKGEGAVVQYLGVKP